MWRWDDPNSDNFDIFAGPGDPGPEFEGADDPVRHWFRFEADPPVSSLDAYDGTFQTARRTDCPGVLTTRDGTRYYFDFSCEVDPNYYDPNDPNTYSSSDPNINADSHIQFLSRKENRYGQGFDYEYAILGHCGAGNVEYLLSTVTSPSGRQIQFRYEDENWTNHVTNVDLADEEGTVETPNAVVYAYYAPDDDPNMPGQLRYARSRTASDAMLAPRCAGNQRFLDIVCLS